MSTETELERMVVKLSGNGESYLQMLDRCFGATSTWAGRTQRELEKVKADWDKWAESAGKASDKVVAAQERLIESTKMLTSVFGEAYAESSKMSKSMAEDAIVMKNLEGAARSLGAAMGSLQDKPKESWMHFGARYSDKIFGTKLTDATPSKGERMSNNYNLTGSEGYQNVVKMGQDAQQGRDEAGMTENEKKTRKYVKGVNEHIRPVQGDAVAAAMIATYKENLKVEKEIEDQEKATKKATEENTQALKEKKEALNDLIKSSKVAWDKTVMTNEGDKAGYDAKRLGGTPDQVKEATKNARFNEFDGMIMELRRQVEEAGLTTHEQKAEHAAKKMGVGPNEIEFAKDEARALDEKANALQRAAEAASEMQAAGAAEDARIKANVQAGEDYVKNLEKTVQMLDMEWSGVKNVNDELAIQQMIKNAPGGEKDHNVIRAKELLKEKEAATERKKNSEETKKYMDEFKTPQKEYAENVEKLAKAREREGAAFEETYRRGLKAEELKLRMSKLDSDAANQHGRNSAVMKDSAEFDRLLGLVGGGNERDKIVKNTKKQFIDKPAAQPYEKPLIAGTTLPSQFDDKMIPITERVAVAVEEQVQLWKGNSTKNMQLIPINLEDLAAN